MMILAIDTALEACSVGLSKDGSLLLREQIIGRGHAERLMPEIAALFAEAGLTPQDVARIAVSIGPGSFTGLRVGISAARGLGLVTGRPVVGISTLHAHAHLAATLRDRAGRAPKPILAVLPARGDEMFGQLFSAAVEPLEPPFVASRADILARLLSGPMDVAGAGAADLGTPHEPLHIRSAPAIQSLAALGQSLDPQAHPPRPLYGKPPDAHPQLRAGIARR